MKKICVHCGSEFDARNMRVTLCPSCVHAMDTCPICGKEKSIWKGTCSRSCAAKLQCMNSNPLNTEKAIEKRKQTCMDKYGSTVALWVLIRRKPYKETGSGLVEIVHLAMWLFKRRLRIHVSCGMVFRSGVAVRRHL